MSKSMYTVCGVSTHNGEQKLRFANSMKRARHLERVGHTGVELVEMPFEGGVADAVDYMLGLEQFKDLHCVRAAAAELGFLGYVEAQQTEAIEA